MITDVLRKLRPGEPFYFENGAWVFENKEVIPPTPEEIDACMAQIEMERLVAEKEGEIETHIYANYPQKKQAQDEKWTSICMTKLKAAGVQDLELKIVQAAGAYFQGQSLEQATASFEGDNELFTRLIKIAVRTEWASLCVAEGVAAIKENRGANYPEWPGI